MSSGYPFTDGQRRQGMRDAILAQCVGMIALQALWTGGLAMIVVLAFSQPDSEWTNFWAMLVHSALHIGFAAGVYVSLRPLPEDRSDFLIRNFRLAALCLVGAAGVVWKAPVEWIVPLFTLLLMACRIFAGMSTAYWFPILQDIVPEAASGRFFSTLRAAWNTVALLSTLGLAAILDRYAAPETDLFRQRETYAVVILVLAVTFWSRNHFVNRLPRVPREHLEPNPAGGLRQIREALRENPKFAYFLVYICVIHLIIGIEQPLLIRTLKELGFADGETMQISILGLVGAIVAFLICTTLVDRVGPRKVFAWGHFVVGLAIAALVGFLWLPEGRGLYLVGLHIVIQGMLAAIGVASSTYLFEILSGTQRSLCFTLALVGPGLTVTGVTVGLGVFLDRGPELLGAGLLDLSGWLFAASGVLMVMTVPMIRGIDHGRWPPKVTS